MSWLAHLSRTRRNRRGELIGVELHFAGDQARGDEHNEPVAVVIDIGRRFVIELDDFGEQVLVPTAPGKAQHQPFTLYGAWNAARQGMFGFTLLWDEQCDVEAAAEEKTA